MLVHTIFSQIRLHFVIAKASYSANFGILTKYYVLGIDTIYVKPSTNH